MIKKILIVFGLFLTISANAQEGTASPYSFYGIGDVKFKGTVENRSMGGLSVIKDSTHINLNNPASYADLKYTTFTVGGNHNLLGLEAGSIKESASRTTFDYLSVGIPLGKFGAGFGLMPFSAVGYKIQNINSNVTLPSYRYTGSGGVNKVYTSLSYKLSNNLSIGADLQYNFGDINTNSISFIQDVQLGTRELNRSIVSGVNFNTGLMYDRKLSSKHTMFASLTYAPESKLTIKNTRNIATVIFSENFEEAVVSDQDIPVNDTKLALPSKYSVGLGFGEVRKWMIGSELTFSNSSNFGNRFNDINNVQYENALKISFGGYYLPNYNSYSNYLKRITYRSGFNFENTGLIINNEPINNRGITFGLGLPLGGTFSNINIGLELGKRGTTNAGLVQENYTNLSFSLSLNDKWFVKRKFD